MPLSPNSRVCCKDRISGLTVGSDFSPTFSPWATNPASVVSGLKVAGPSKIHFAPGCLHLSFDASLNTAIELDKTLRVEIDIGQGGKKGLHGEHIDLPIVYSYFSPFQWHIVTNPSGRKPKDPGALPPLVPCRKRPSWCSLRPSPFAHIDNRTYLCLPSPFLLSSVSCI